MAFNDNAYLQFPVKYVNVVSDFRRELLLECQWAFAISQVRDRMLLQVLQSPSQSIMYLDSFVICGTHGGLVVEEFGSELRTRVQEHVGLRATSCT